MQGRALHAYYDPKPIPFTLLSFAIKAKEKSPLSRAFQKQLFDNGAIYEIKPLVDMAHVDNDEIDFELENIRDMGNGWVQFTLSGYHGQDAFESEIQLNMDDPDTYVLL